MIKMMVLMMLLLLSPSLGASSDRRGSVWEGVLGKVTWMHLAILEHRLLVDSGLLWAFGFTFGLGPECGYPSDFFHNANDHTMGMDCYVETHALIAQCLQQQRDDLLADYIRKAEEGPASDVQALCAFHDRWNPQGPVIVTDPSAIILAKEKETYMARILSLYLRQFHLTLPQMAGSTLVTEAAMRSARCASSPAPISIALQPWVSFGLLRIMDIDFIAQLCWYLTRIPFHRLPVNNYEDYLSFVLGWIEDLTRDLQASSTITMAHVLKFSLTTTILMHRHVYTTIAKPSAVKSSNVTYDLDDSGTISRPDQLRLDVHSQQRGICELQWIRSVHPVALDAFSSYRRAFRFHLSANDLF
jgi:hypothetical protein